MKSSLPSSWRSPLELKQGPSYYCYFQLCWDFLSHKIFRIDFNIAREKVVYPQSSIKISIYILEISSDLHTMWIFESVNLDIAGKSWFKTLEMWIQESCKNSLNWFTFFCVHFGKRDCKFILTSWAIQTSNSFRQKWTNDFGFSILYNAAFPKSKWSSILFFFY